MSEAIVLSGLGQRYGAQYVFRDLNLVIDEGRTVVLQGSNGSGKTTLLKVLSTRLRPSRGGGRVFGYDLVKEASQVRAKVAYLSVLGGSYPGLSAFENLRFAAMLYGHKASEAELLARLERVELKDARDTLVRRFSSGMKKRLGLARLLLSDAALWLLDEPYAALDEGGRALIDTLLTEAKAEGRTVVMASHEGARSRAFADAILRLQAGRLELQEAAYV